MTQTQGNFRLLADSQNEKRRAAGSSDSANCHAGGREEKVTNDLIIFMPSQSVFLHCTCSVQFVAEYLRLNLKNIFIQF